jgi:hypothetical protein
VDFDDARHIQPCATEVGSLEPRHEQIGTAQIGMPHVAL